MLFQATLSIPANTVESDPVIQRISIYPGMTDTVWIGFPTRCAALARIAVFHLHTQLWPTTPGQWFAWDGYVFRFRDQYRISQPPYELVLKGWNEDDTYDHDVLFGVVILSTPSIETAFTIDQVRQDLGLI